MALAHMSELTVEQLDMEAWYAAASQFTDFNYRQTWSYAHELAQCRRARCECVAVYRSGHCIGVAAVRIKQLPIIGGGLAYISGGPVVKRAGVLDEGDFASCVAAIVEKYATERGLVLQIVPPIGPSDAMESVVQCVVAAGFKPATSVHAYRTLLVDIARPEADIRRFLDQKWRNCLNGSEKQLLTVELGSDMEMFDRFAPLLEALEGKKGFSTELGTGFYRRIQAGLCPNEQLVVGLVSQNDEIHAGGVFAIHGDTAVYLLGATAEGGKKTRASYLLHWSVIRHAKARGAAWYDLGGIDPDGNPGVYAFKKGFSGKDVTSLPYEYRPGGLRSIATALSERAYRSVRRWR